MDPLLDHGHLEDGELARILDEAEGPALLHRLIPHLARGCETCRMQFRRLEELQRRWGYWDPAVVVVEDEEVEAHLEELLATDDPFAELAERPELSGWCLTVRLHELSLASEDGKALDTANLALWASQHLGGLYDPLHVADLQARILSRAAVILKRLGELRSAQWSFRQSKLALERGTGDPGIDQEVTEAGIAFEGG